MAPMQERVRVSLSVPTGLPVLLPKDDHGHSLLSYAAEEGHEPVVKILVMQDDVEVNTKDNHGHSLLSSAAKHVNEAVVKMLVAWDNVKVNTKDDHGCSLMPPKMGMRQW